MRAGDRAILIDNVERTLQSTKLNILITSGALKDRVLGESRDVVLNNFAVVFATGNNITIGGDLTVRSLRCDIDPRMERPEERGFEFDPVKLAIDRHPQLVVAALTALRAYVIAGCPWTPKRKSWGGFEIWDELVCGCLVWLGYADPYGARDRVIGADPIRSENAELLELWHKLYKGIVVSLDDIRKDKETEVYAALLQHGVWDGHHVKWVLRRLEGRICDGYRLVRFTGRGRFKVEKVDEPGGTCRRQTSPRPANPEPDDSLNQDMPF
jgi:putative DNA primase/helicase